MKTLPIVLVLLLYTVQLFGQSELRLKPQKKDYLTASYVGAVMPAIASTAWAFAHMESKGGESSNPDGVIEKSFEDTPLLVLAGSGAMLLGSSLTLAFESPHGLGALKRGLCLCGLGTAALYGFTHYERSGLLLGLAWNLAIPCIMAHYAWKHDCGKWQKQSRSLTYYAIPLEKGAGFGLVYHF